MKMLLVGALALSMAAATAASAQPNGHDPRDQRGDHQDNNHHDNGAGGHPGWGQDYGGGGHHWNRGQRMGYNDWSGAQPVDYRSHHLRRPPHGYEWRESNGQYILAAVATGLIASIILNSGH